MSGRLVIDRHHSIIIALTLCRTTHKHPNMSQNVAMLAQIAQMEASLAIMRAMLTGSTDAPRTPTKAKAPAQAPGAPVKGVAEPLTAEDLNAMVKAGVKPKAQVKGLAKTVFKALGLPEYLHAAAREQWKAYRETVSDEDVALAEQEPVLTEEICQALRGCKGKNGKEFDAKTRTSWLAAEFTDYEIHPILHDKAGKEWREWAEQNGLGERMKAPKRSAGSTKPKKEALPALLTEEMLQTIRESKDDKGSAFHSGSQKRKLAPTLTGLGIAEKDHARAAKEWKAWAKEQGIAREGSTTSSKASSKASSTAGSEGVPESVGPTASVPAPVTPPSPAASASASRSAKPLTPSMLSRISETFSTTQTPSTIDLRKVFKAFGVPKTVWVIAEKQWNEWAKDNHIATDDDDLELDD